MNISYKWLKQYLEPELTLGPDELAAALTSIGLETGGVERVESIRGGLRGIVIGKVLTCVDHPDSDHLHITTVDLGLPEGPVQIVCGAPNVAAGQTVVVATVGTTLYDGDKEFKIKKSKIRGVESFGMICAEDEIGIGTSHDGIIVLGAEADSFIGRPAADYYNVEDDYVLEVDLTPNRIDAASHYGVARDLAARQSVHSAEMKAVRPSVEGFSIDRPDEAGVSVDISRADGGVTRYCGLTIKGVSVKESPEWLKERLTAIGLRPHNNIVDITNYILHAFCQPLHCFDASTLKGGHVVVRRAHEGEKFVTLDAVERTLSCADLMICDGSDAKCIAGVFGGLESGTTERTTDIFLESACFNPTSVRRTARRLGISTDSSFRYERGVDPNGCEYALKLAAMMVKELAGGEIVGSLVDLYPEPVKPYAVELSYAQVWRLIGREIPAETIDKILEALEIRIAGRRVCAECGEEVLELEVPTYRFDVRRPCDVIEEILRIYGYNNIEMNDELHACISYKTATDKDDALRRLISEQLTGAGFNEILNNSLTAEGYYEGLAEYPVSGLVHLLNPLSQELNVMRGTMLFGGLESVVHNVNRRASDLALYEFGKVYAYNPEKGLDDSNSLAAYYEETHLALWMTGNRRPAGHWLRKEEEATFYDLKGAVENVFRRLGLESKIVFDTEAPLAEGDMFAEKQRIIMGGGTTVGFIGRVNPALARKLDVKVPVYYCELLWDKLSKASLKTKTEFTPLPKTQPVKRDLSLLIDCGVSFAEVEKAVREAERKLLTGVSLFDVYEGKNLPAGKKSYAISMTLQDPEKTLQDKHIDKIMTKIIETLRSKFNAELR
ncbi:MAG: phenylalanine--tRNA ligase subunit beta [Muribaculaceae bacterium]|nr:phenylalanine--tRNA ligase subunit beta [Muribaculaceae bacterium]